MTAHFFEDTICAIATPPGMSAVGIVRVTGARALAVVAPLFGGRGRLADVPTHTARYATVRDPTVNAPNPDGCETAVDEALFW